MLQGKPLRVVGTLRNITESKLYEKTLMEAKQNVEKIQEINQLILDHSNNGLVYLHPELHDRVGELGPVFRASAGR